MSWYKQGQLNGQESSESDSVQVQGWGIVRRDQALSEAIRRCRAIAEALEAGQRVSPHEFELAKMMYEAYLQKRSRG